MKRQEKTTINLTESERADIMARLEQIIIFTKGRKKPIKKALAYLNGLMMDIRFGGFQND